MNVGERAALFGRLYLTITRLYPGDRVVAESWPTGIVRSHNIHHESITISHFIECLHSKEVITLQNVVMSPYVSFTIHHLHYDFPFTDGLMGVVCVCHVSCVASYLSLITWYIHVRTYTHPWHTAFWSWYTWPLRSACWQPLWPRWMPIWSTICSRRPRPSPTFPRNGSWFGHGNCVEYWGGLRPKSPNHMCVSHHSCFLLGRNIRS